VLAYPVISMVPGITHGGSRTSLIGDNPDPELQTSLSAEKRVALDTPPTFLFHTTNDDIVPVENALLFAGALAAHQVPFELHVYESGPHGVGLAPTDAVLATWSGHLETWLANR
jgi:dipeptidyl aminopeptidase/acylaminoacyl peptidase